jgi:uncharacterized protein
MTRPFKKRKIRFKPGVTYFKPRGVPLSILEEVNLSMDEIEAIHLSDFKGINQTQASKNMGISQSTFQRTLEKAHQKIAEALIEGKAIKVRNMLQ